jgi:hypothetical protein
MVGAHKLGEFTWAEALNNEYGITDRDINVIAENSSADRHGLANTGLRNLYYFSIRQDFYNRMQILVACMLEDGCFEAFSFDKNTGVLTYDMSKDKRFEEFWKHKNDPNYKKTQ